MSTGVCRGVLALGIGSVLLFSGCDQGEFARGFKVNPDLRREQWLQPVASEVDVLFVIDTSCSMIDEQEALAQNGPSFTSFFVESGIPLRIGVTSTNVDEDDTEGLDGQLAGDPTFLSWDQVDLEEAFLDRTLMGIDEGHRYEKGLHAAWTALEELGDGANSDFERDEANLVIIVVSDEPDFSETGHETSSSWINWEDFADWLDEYKGNDTAHRTRLSAIVGVGVDGFDDPEGCNQDASGEDPTQGAKRGTGYLEAVEATDGFYQSICTDDWGQVLERMGLLAAGLLDTFVMTEPPKPQSIQIEVNGRLEPRWSLLPHENAIYFDDVDAIPPPGSEIEVRYMVLDSH